MKDLGVIETKNYDQFAARGINDSGRVVGFSRISTATILYAASCPNGHPMTDLGTLIELLQLRSAHHFLQQRGLVHQRLRGGGRQVVQLR